MRITNTLYMNFNFKYFKKNLLAIIAFVGFYAFSQNVPSSLRTPNTNCWDCVPNSGWTKPLGTPDVSSANIAAATSTQATGQPWIGAPLPLPPNNHERWITMRDLGGAGSEEIIETTMTNLVVGREYELLIYTSTFRTTGNYSPVFNDQFQYLLEGQTARVVVPSITQNSWATSRLRFVASNVSRTIRFFPGENGGGTAAYESVNLSLSLNAINSVPIAVADNVTTSQGVSVSINVSTNDSDPSGGVLNVASVDLDPSTPAIDTFLNVNGEGTWSVNSSGVVTFTPIPFFTGVATRPYTIKDNYTLDGSPVPATSNPANISVTVTPKDSDGDGIVDNLDLDDDNDGILDLDEASCNALTTEVFSSLATAAVQQTPSAISLTATSDAPSNPYVASTAYNFNFGTGAGKRLETINFASGRKLSLIPSLSSSEVTFRRNASVPADEIVWLEAGGTTLAGGATNILHSYPADVASVFRNGYYNSGIDNMFNNTGTNRSNVERIDVVFRSPYRTANPSNDYVVVSERGANDNVLIAAITAVDSNGIPTAFGPVQTIQASTMYGSPAIPQAIFRKVFGETTFRPNQLLNQNVGLGIITLNALGITAGQQFLGYAILPADYNTANIVNWNTYPVNTPEGSGGGVDFGVVYGLFSSCEYDVDTDADLVPNRLDTDSDNDGCPDAVEGSEAVRITHVYPMNFATVALRGQIKVLANGTTAGTPAQVVSNIAAANGVPQLVNNSAGNPAGVGAGAVDNTDSPTPTADIGQGVGTSQNNSVKDIECERCFRPAATGPGTLQTSHGITALSRGGAANGNWPMKINGAYTALDAKTKGFVINRLTDAEIAAIPANTLVVGMMVFDRTANCLKIYDGTSWSCYTKPTCDNLNL